jgi:hypothetical protein
MPALPGGFLGRGGELQKPSEDTGKYAVLLFLPPTQRLHRFSDKMLAAPKASKIFIFANVFGATRRIRTDDLLITNL